MVENQLLSSLSKLKVTEFATEKEEKDETHSKQLKKKEEINKINFFRDFDENFFLKRKRNQENNVVLLTNKYKINKIFTKSTKNSEELKEIQEIYSNTLNPKVYLIEISNFNKTLLEESKNSVVKVIFSNEKIKKKIKKLFPDYFLSGRLLYCQNLTKNIENEEVFEFDIEINQENEVNIIKNIEKTQSKRVFSIKIIPKFEIQLQNHNEINEIHENPIKSYKDLENEKIKRKAFIQYINIIIKKKLTEENQFKFESFSGGNKGRKIIIDISNQAKSMKKNQIFIKNPRNQIDSIYLQGFSVTFNKNHLLIMTINEKYVLIRNITYWSYFNIKLNKDKTLFMNMINHFKQGYALHIDKPIRFEKAEFLNLKQVFFEKKLSNQRIIISVYDYMVNTYSVIFKEKSIDLIENQWVLISDDQRQNRRLYFPSQLVLIRGHLPDDNLTNSSKLIKSPYEKLSLLHSCTEIISKHIDMSLIQVVGIKFEMPCIFFGNNQKFQIPPTGEINLNDLNYGFKPIIEENTRKIRKAIFLFHDLKGEFRQIDKGKENINYFIDTFSKSLLRIHIIIEKIESLVIENYEKDIGNFYETLIKTKKYKEVDVVLFVSSSMKSTNERIYKTFKNEYFHKERYRKLRHIASQFCLYNPYEEMKMSKLKGLVFQIYSKISNRLFKVDYKKILNFENNSNISTNNITNTQSVYSFIKNKKFIIGGYCVNSKKEDFLLDSSYFSTSHLPSSKALTTLVCDFSLFDEDLKIFNKIHDEMNKTTIEIRNLLRNSIENYVKSQVESNFSSSYPEFIVLYREYNQNIDKIISIEIVEIENMLLEYFRLYNVRIKLYVVFVNKNGDLRLFDEKPLNTRNINEKFDFSSISLISSYENRVFNENPNFSHDFLIKNAPVGCFIYDKINKTYDNPYIKEYYIQMTGSERVSVPPTQYLLYTKEALDYEIYFEFITKISFYQGFSGKTTFKTLKLPSLLHYSLNMNKFCLRNLNEECIPHDSEYLFSI